MDEATRPPNNVVDEAMRPTHTRNSLASMEVQSNTSGVKLPKSRQFRIKTILALTAVVALLMAIRQWTLVALEVGLVIIHAYVLLGPVVIVFVSIVCGPQVDNRIEVSDNKLIRFLLGAWLSCIAVVFLFWALVSSL